MAAYDVGEDLDYPEGYILPMLYTIDKSGKKRLWRVCATGNSVIRIQGLVDGKKQTYTRTFEGKNIGKKNETSPEEQAKMCAETMWAKQITKKYFPECKEGKALLKKIEDAAAKTGGHNINASAAMGGRKEKVLKDVKNLIVPKVSVNIKPMKAEVWSNKPADLKYFDFEEGVYLQRKFDGWRCTARLQKGEDGEDVCVLTTNSGKQYPWFGKLREELVSLLKGKEYLDGLDGELYAHRIIGENGEGLSDEARFAEICGMCGIRRTSPHPLEDQICFYVFDLVDLSGKHDQDSRFQILKELFKLSRPYEPIVDKEHFLKEPKYRVNLCDVVVAYFIEEVYSYHDEVAQQGFEGVIVRARQLHYTSTRSRYMRKYKQFQDREYQIVDVMKDEGVDSEYFVWVCHDPSIIDKTTNSPIRFRAKPMGCREDRRYWYKNYLEYIGRMLTVKFQDYSEEGIPRFPIAKGIREEY